MLKGIAPPTRAGIGPSCVNLPAGNWPTLLDFLSARFPGVARLTWLDRLERGLVFDQSARALSVQQACQARYPPSGHVFYYREVPNEPVIPFHEVLLYQDQHLLVVDKPHFLPVLPSGDYLAETLLVRLKRKLGIDTLVPLHRIDRETAGLVMLSLTPASRAAYCALFRNRQIHKTYQAIAPWHAGVPRIQTRQSRIKPAQHFMQQCEVCGAANALTQIEVIEVQGERARYCLRPLSGQRHQLRVHMLALGLPICHDRLYPTLRARAPADYAQPLQLLAQQLEFTDPLSGAPRHFVSRQKLNF